MSWEASHSADSFTEHLLFVRQGAGGPGTGATAGNKTDAIPPKLIGQVVHKLTWQKRRVLLTGSAKRGTSKADEIGWQEGVSRLRPKRAKEPACN